MERQVAAGMDRSFKAGSAGRKILLAGTLAMLFGQDGKGDRRDFRFTTPLSPAPGQFTI